MRLQYFDFKFEHVPGDVNIADAPSRIARKQSDLDYDLEKKSQELFAVEAEPARIQEDLLVVTSEEVSSEMLKDGELILVKKHLNDQQKWPSRSKTIPSISKGDIHGWGSIDERN